MALNSYLRTQHITRLVDALRVIAPGAAFERFGGRLLDFLLDSPLTHRGLNVLGHPVGGRVDTRDEYGERVAEYSTEQDYFSGAMPKARNDLLHALRTHNEAKEIFLLSSQKDTSGRSDAFIADAIQWPGNYGRQVHVYDSRKLAELIIDHLLTNDTAVEDLSEYLPVLKQLRDEHAANLYPPTPKQRHIPRQTVTDEITRRLEAQSCLMLWGIGGAGKSEAAAAYASEHSDQFHLIIWVDGEHVRSAADLRSIPLVRGGDRQNVAAMLKSNPVLLIIDDPTDALDSEELGALCGEGSKIIVTQRARDPSGYEMPLMTEQEAKDAVDIDAPEICPDEIFREIWSATGGHPLTLSLINAAVRDNASWQDIRADCEAVGQLQDGNQRIADRLLARFRASVELELSVFAWLETPSVDRGLLLSLIRPLGLRKLVQHGLTTVSQPRRVRIHDIVFASLRADNWLSDQRTADLNHALVEYISRTFMEDDLALVALSVGTKEKLHSLVSQGDRRPAILLALMNGWRIDEIDIALIGSPADDVRALVGRHAESVPIEIACVMEKVEYTYRATKSLDFDAAKAGLAENLTIFDALLELPAQTPRQHSEMLHHKAKALKILGRRDEATALFEQVVSGPFPLHESRLQLVREYSKSNPERAAELAATVLAAAQNGKGVSISVLLATVEALPWGGGAWRDQLTTTYKDIIAARIIDAAQAGLDQAYMAFASVGRHWAWVDPERFKQIWISIPQPSVDPDMDDREKFALGELFSLAAKVYPERIETLHAAGLAFYESMGKRDSFANQKYGELLFGAGRNDDAIAVLSALPNLNSNPFGLYWLSKAQLGAGDLAASRGNVDLAISILPSNRQNYLSTLLSHRFEVRTAQGEDAVDDLRQAVAACTNDKYREQLEAKLNGLEN